MGVLAGPQLHLGLRTHPVAVLGPGQAAHPQAWFTGDFRSD